MQGTCTVQCYCTFSFSVHTERAKRGKKKPEINVKERSDVTNSIYVIIFKDIENLQILLIVFPLVNISLLTYSSN